MSRTTKDVPQWVRIKRAHAQGAVTEIHHDVNCEDRFNRRTGEGPTGLRRVWLEEPEAQAAGYDYTLTISGKACATVPTPPTPCTVDMPQSKCCRALVVSPNWLPNDCGCCGPDTAREVRANRSADRAWKTRAIRQARWGDYDLIDDDPAMRTIVRGRMKRGFLDNLWERWRE